MKDPNMLKSKTPISVSALTAHPQSHGCVWPLRQYYWRLHCVLGGSWSVGGLPRRLHHLLVVHVDQAGEQLQAAQCVACNNGRHLYVGESLDLL